MLAILKPVAHFFETFETFLRFEKLKKIQISMVIAL